MKTNELMQSSFLSFVRLGYPVQFHNQATLTQRFKNEILGKVHFFNSLIIFRSFLKLCGILKDPML